MLEKSRIYECARKVAGEETVVTLGKTLGNSTVSYVPAQTFKHTKSRMPCLRNPDEWHSAAEIRRGRRREFDFAPFAWSFFLMNFGA